MNLPKNYKVWKICQRDNGTACVILARSQSGDFASSYETGTLGWFDSEQSAIDETQAFVNIHKENTMNIFRNTEMLFPHIKGEMLRDNPVVLHLSGKYREILPDTKQGGNKSRLEIYFTDHKKTAIVNATQVLKIANMYGPETNDWAGKPVVLYAEDGAAFGNSYCAVRIADHLNDEGDKRSYGRLVKAKAKAKEQPEDVEQGQLIDAQEVEYGD
jgi:hypothetical protein